MRFAKFALLSYILERDKKNAVLFRADYSMKIEKGSGSAEVAERGQRAIERSREAPGARQARAADHELREHRLARCHETALQEGCVDVHFSRAGSFVRNEKSIACQDGRVKQFTSSEVTSYAAGNGH